MTVEERLKECYTLDSIISEFWPVLEITEKYKNPSLPLANSGNSLRLEKKGCQPPSQPKFLELPYVFTALPVP